MNSRLQSAAIKCAALVTVFAVLAGTALAAKEPVDYVKPDIGGIGLLLTATLPYVQRPHGMARLAPVTTPGITDRYLADKIYGFPVGPGLLMASAGEESTRVADYAADFDHDFETATPYYFSTRLEGKGGEAGILAEFTAGQQTAYYRFTFPASHHAHLVLSLEKGSQMEVMGRRAVQGSQRIDGVVGKLAHAAGGTTEYFYAEASRAAEDAAMWTGDRLGDANKRAGDHIGLVTDMTTHAGEVVEVRVGISYISAEQAKRNLEREIPEWTFDKVKEAARAEWNKALGGVEVEGGTDKQRTIFYTALYHTMIDPRTFQDVNGDFFGSSPISGECRADFQEEVGVVPEAKGHALNHLDLVVDPFQHTGVQRPAAMGDDPRQIALEFFGEGRQRTDPAVRRPRIPALPEVHRGPRQAVIPQSFQIVFHHVHAHELPIGVQKFFQSHPVLPLLNIVRIL